MNQKTYALHIGLNRVNPNCYPNDWEGILNCCEADAKAMEAITKSLKYETEPLLLTEKATRSAFFKASNAIQQKLKAGDLFVLTFSGHGGQVEDENGDEKDGKDEIWCFYDGQLLDDQINKWLKSFKAGVRILIIADSCHSGTMLKEDEAKVRKWGRTEIKIGLEGVPATVCLLASSQEYQVSCEKGKYGLFTRNLLDVWDEGYFDGNYQEFYNAIVERMPQHKDQTPNLQISDFGDPYFEENIPFRFLQKS